MCKTCEIKSYEKGHFFYRFNQTGKLEYDTKIEEMIKDSDWDNSIYFSLNEDVANGYHDDKHTFKMKVQNNAPIKYILCTHESFKTGDYEAYMEDIIKEIEGLICKDKPQNMPFMKWLGSLEYAFQCFHNQDSDDMEIAIPKNLLRKETFEVKCCEEIPVHNTECPKRVVY